jgi:uncharacterized beta-barrel protein YwiB (DUF1934 family)
MWWYRDGAPERVVSIVWQRVERPVAEVGGDAVPADGTARDVVEERVAAASWRQRGGAHWLVYQEPPESGASAGDGRNALRIEPNALTWMRRGAVDWTQRFIPGVTTQSWLNIGGRSMPVTVTTERMDATVSEGGGS